MKRPAVMSLTGRPEARTEWTGPTRVVAIAMATAIWILLSLGCVTPLPRPDSTTATPPVAVTPALPETSTAVPTPTSRPVPTLAPSATPVPTVQSTQVPTRQPGPIDPTHTPGPLPSPSPTEDSSGLMLQVYAPEDGAVVPGSVVAVYGQTLPGARVFIDGEETGVDAQGGFRAEVSLAPNENDVTIVAQDETGRRRSLSRTVTSLALPFLLLVTEPENESIVSVSVLRLAGRTGPNAIVSINGRSVPVDRFGYFSGTVSLDDGPNVIDVVATNDDGRTLSTVVAVIYRPPS